MNSYYTEIDWNSNVGFLSREEVIFFLKVSY